MKNNTHDLHECVKSNLENYFKNLDGEQPSQVWSMVTQCIEKSMLEVVMDKCAHNQSKASEMLGITRNTLRKKLVNYQLID